MASNKSYLDFILDNLSDLDGISFRPMMGEYILYYKGKVVGGVYDDRLLLKPTSSALRILSEPEMALPYEGAKEMILVTDLDDRTLLANLIQAIDVDLPAKKK